MPKSDEPAVQFCVVAIPGGFKVFAQNSREIVRSYLVAPHHAPRALNDELSLLQPIAAAPRSEAFWAPDTDPA
jgi:hypothetical protein